MQEKMTFLEKWMYRLGLKSAVKPSKKDDRSPLEVAAQEGDMERLDFFSKYDKDIARLSRSAQSALTTALTRVSTVAVLRKLEDMGANMQENMLQRICGNMYLHMMNHCSSGDFLENAKYLHQNGFSITPHLRRYKYCSLYDCIKKKEIWFAAATPEEIGAEFLAAAKHGDIRKVQEMLRIGKGKVDINYMNSDKRDAMSYAIELSAETEAVNMSLFLYENGARLDTKGKDNLNTFERVRNEKVKNALVKACIKKGDLLGLQVACKAGTSFDNKDYLLITQDHKTLRFLAKNGAPIDEVISSLEDSNQKDILSAVKHQLEGKETTSPKGNNNPRSPQSPRPQEIRRG